MDLLLRKTEISKLVHFMLLLIAMFYYKPANAQANLHRAKLAKPEFANQGEQEDYWAKELFGRYYKKQHYKKRVQPIISDGNVYKYDKVVITIAKSTLLKALFDEGIFYPDIMAIAGKYQPKGHVKINKDSLLAWSKKDTSKTSKSVLLTPDSLFIDNFEEMKFLEKTPESKRFRFWVFTKGFANPTIYFMELTNNKVTANTDLISFINGARLTFFQQGWVII